MRRVFHAESTLDVRQSRIELSNESMQARSLHNPGGDRERDYWKTRLARKPEMLDLPTDRPRPAQSSGRRGRELFALPVASRLQLERLAIAEYSTVFTVLLAAFQTMLHRYTGQTDILVGSPVARRPAGRRPANTIVLRGDLSGQPSFRELVRRLRETVLEAHAHQAPYEQLLEAIDPAEDGGREPLFQVALTVENGMDWRNPQTTGESRFAGEAECDLHLRIGERGSELAGALEYSADLFDSATAHRMVGNFLTLLSSAVAGPDQPIFALDLLSAAERQQMLVDWNDNAAELPDKCIHELFEEHARNSPDSTAVVFQGQSLTYAELDRRARRLAQHLRELGVRPGVLVGIFADRSLEMIVAVLGTLKAGGAYVPLDPAYPKERLEFMATDAAVPVLLTQSRLLNSLPVATAQAVALDEFDWDRPSDVELPAVSPEDLVYVIYTSGSTGNPKGAAIMHRGLVNTINAFSRRIGYGKHDHLLAISTLSFDITALDIYIPLTNGSAFTVVSRETATDAQALAEAIESNGVTYMQATPATWRMLVQSGWPGKKDMAIFSGGEKLPRDLADELLPRCRAVWNGYGPTEISICCTMSQVEAGEGSVPIGRPLANTLHYILDSQMQPVPAGVPGELYIGGAGLAREYLNRLDLTAERFIMNPFGSGLVYKSGDLVRWRTDGQIEFLGRTDDQVKLRGFRIELGEIEAVLQRHPAVTAVCATIREDMPGAPYIAAYYIAEPGHDDLDRELRELLRQRVPVYMVASRYMQLDKFPLTPSGKVNRRALPAPPAQDASHSEKTVSLTPMQQMLVEVWEEVLGITGVQPQDNFYELGGHSLLATEVAQRMEKRTGIRVQPAVLVFQSLGQVAAQYERSSAKPAKDANPRWSSRLARSASRLLGISVR
jgi:amino acid adenylation domain-containing protein